MFTASDFRSEKGRTNLAIHQIAVGADVSYSTVARLLHYDSNPSVTLAKARLVMDHLMGLPNGDSPSTMRIRNGEITGFILGTDQTGFDLFVTFDDKPHKVRFDVTNGLISQTSKTELENDPVITNMSSGFNRNREQDK